eukprot:CAMPEP_0118697938 /NCGR_PEP_ID=MMETSP0800-20121206/14866_1 /TAXON_ID=210618 ORGANISM="Striatella unipunctata, Strain CCMP2910" /NCGR_SAMPLE_ID=MMETSP0800 /ASSEMBLY_ACC=CAM_ASM_000638 /LENGTH=160 /DNA_ID=CAMNT_0006597589 /DNA_START=85 /DNA_END=567 /DNA_ORIENTATION=+
MVVHQGLRLPPTTIVIESDDSTVEGVQALLALAKRKSHAILSIRSAISPATVPSSIDSSFCTARGCVPGLCKKRHLVPDEDSIKSRNAATEERDCEPPQKRIKMGPPPFRPLSMPRLPVPAASGNGGSLVFAHIHHAAIPKGEDVGRPLKAPPRLPYNIF